MWLWRSHLSNKTYKLHEYDCTEFTNDFHKILKENGIESKIAFGYFKGRNILHCWLEIDGEYFEATKGYYKDKSKYVFKKNLGLRP